LKRFRATSLTSAILAVTAATGADAASFRGDYTVSYLGLTVARSTMTSTIDGKAYAIDGSVSTAGLGKIFDDTKATLSVSGRLSSGRAVPVRAHTDYKHDKKSKQLTITFAKGNVVDTVVVPPPKPRSADWIAVTNDQLRSVVDPLSALLVSSERMDEVCDRTVKFFDGEMRFDLKLRRDDVVDVDMPGYKGQAVTCSARFVPVSGYRAKKKSVKFMRDKGRISITFAPLGSTGVYAPIRASVGTEIGTLKLHARKVEAIE